VLRSEQGNLNHGVLASANNHIAFMAGKKIKHNISVVRRNCNS
jgi:hypothetical protein